MTQSTRNRLEAAYAAAESLYDSGVALSQLLDAYSKRDREPVFTEDARAYVAQNLLNAEASLRELRQALAVFMDVQPETHPGDQTQWHRSEGCGDGSVGQSCVMPAGRRPGVLSGSSGSAGGII